MHLDDIDREIVSALSGDGRRAYSKIAEQLDIAESVVRYRVQRLEKAGLLQIVGLANPLKVGFELTALIGVQAAPGKLDDVAKFLAQLGETSFVARTAGRFDLIIEVVCRDTKHFASLLGDTLQSLDGVERTESFLVLSIDKMSYGWDIRLAAD